MASGITHPVPALALASLFRSARLPRRILVAAVACSLAPDLDVFATQFGAGRDSMFMHRGLTHSLTFAAALGGIVALAVARGLEPSRRRAAWLYLFLATASHGICDALTNGGLGIAFFAPFSMERYFFPVRPIQVSPIGLSRFASRAGVVLCSEAVWVWLPSLLFVLLVHAAARWRGSERSSR